MPTDGSEQVSRFTMERVSLADAPSHGYFHYDNSILNRTYYRLTLVTFYLLSPLPVSGRSSSPATLHGRKDLGL